jgi:hypothetical protein
MHGSPALGTLWDLRSNTWPMTRSCFFILQVQGVPSATRREEAQSLDVQAPTSPPLHVVINGAKGISLMDEIAGRNVVDVPGGNIGIEIWMESTAPSRSPAGHVPGAVC